MSDIVETPGARFGTLIRDARSARGWTQEQLIARVEASRSTLLRWEAGDIRSPNLSQVRELCDVLGLDRVEVSIALGLMDRDDLDRPPPGPPMDPLLVRIARFFSDDRIPDRMKATLRAGVTSALEMWFSTYSYKNPRELSAADRQAAAELTGDIAPESQRDASQS